jgi:hypothetical protein
MPILKSARRSVGTPSFIWAITAWTPPRIRIKQGRVAEWFKAPV